MKNNNIYRRAFLLLCFFSALTGASAQEAAVSGRLVDSASTDPVAAGTISFFEPGRKISRTILSDQAGAFQTALPNGNYRLSVTHGSFKRKAKHLLVDGKPVDLGTIQMVPMSKSLAGVTVTVKKPLVEQLGDRIVYNVEEDPTAKSESASEILRKTPFVNVDGDGAIQVNGQTNFRVLLDGRETALFSQNVKGGIL